MSMSVLVKLLHEVTHRELSHDSEVQPSGALSNFHFMVT